MNDIMDYVKRYPTYIGLSPFLPAELLINHDIPLGSWQKLSTACTNWDDKMFYSSWTVSPTILPFTTCSATIANAIINYLTDLFALEGFLPQELFTDNGHPFRSKECTHIPANMTSGIQHLALINPNQRFLHQSQCLQSPCVLGTHEAFPNTYWSQSTRSHGNCP